MCSRNTPVELNLLFVLPGVPVPLPSNHLSRLVRLAGVFYTQLH